MKKLITVCLIMTATFSVKAQLKLDNLEIENLIWIIQNTKIDSIKTQMLQIDCALVSEKSDASKAQLIFEDTDESKIGFFYENKKLKKLVILVNVIRNESMSEYLINEGYKKSKEEKKDNQTKEVNIFVKPDSPFKFIFKDTGGFFFKYQLEVTIEDTSYKIDTNENRGTATQEIAQEQKAYYDNGQLKSIGNFTNDKQIGEWKFYHENGKLSQIGKFTNGKTNGEWKFYYENAQLKQIGNFSNSKESGEWKSYNDNGQLIQIANYSDGKLNGEVKMYSESGELQQIRNYKDDIQNGEYKFYSKSGQLSSIGNYIDGKQTGEWKEYQENGQLSSIGNYTNDAKNGEWKFFNQNGKLNYIGKFTNSKQTGEWKKFNENSELIETKMFDVNGKEIEIKKETITNENDNVDDFGDFDDFLPEYYWDVDYMNTLSLISKKQYKNAIFKLDAILKKYPLIASSNTRCDAYFYRGQAKYFLGNYKEAIEDFNVLIEFNKSNLKSPEGFFYRGLSKINLKQMDAGCLDLFKAKEDFPAAEKEIEKYCK